MSCLDSEYLTINNNTSNNNNNNNMFNNLIMVNLIRIKRAPLSACLDHVTSYLLRKRMGFVVAKIWATIEVDMDILKK